MRNGWLPANALKRSTLHVIGRRDGNVLAGAGIGRSFSALRAGDHAVISAESMFRVEDRFDIRAGFYRAANALAAAGAAPEAMDLCVMLPPSAREIRMKELMQELEALAESENIEITGVRPMTSEAVNSTVVSIVMFGAEAYPGDGSRAAYEKIHTPVPGETLILIGWIAMEGTSLLALRNHEELAERFPGGFLRSAEGLWEEISVRKAANLVREFCTDGACMMYNLSEGGILGGLWEFAESGNVGLDVDLKAIPIRQETVEVCEYLHRNPYQLTSGGSLLIAAEKPEPVLTALEEAGIPAAVIGRTTGGNDRILHNEDEIRYLDRPGMDEIWKKQEEE